MRKVEKVGTGAKAPEPSLAASWETEFREIQELAGLPPPTEKEMERERRIRDVISQEASWSSARIRELTPLLFGQGVSDKQAETLIPAYLRLPKGISGGAVARALGAIWPLQVWPSDLLRTFGSEVLFHPYVVRAISELSNLAKDPRTVKAVATGAALKSVIQRMRHEPIESAHAALRDEHEPEGLTKLAKAELMKVFKLLSGRAAPVKLRSMRRFRTLVRFNKLRTDWNGNPRMSEEEVVTWIADHEGRSVASVRSDIQKARQEIGERKLPYRRRGPRHSDSDKALGRLFQAAAIPEDEPETS